MADVDPQGYASHYFGASALDQAGVYEAVFQHVDAAAVISETPFFGLRLLPSSTKWKQAEEELLALKLSSQPYRHLLKEALSRFENDYDFIILDCPPQGYKLLEIIETYADYILLPMIPDDYALHSITVKAQAFAAARRHNPRLSVLGALIVMDETRDSTKRAYKEALKQQRLFPCFEQTVRKNTTLARAINAKEPINVYNRRCNGNLDYQAVTDELLRRIAK